MNEEYWYQVLVIYSAFM